MNEREMMKKAMFTVWIQLSGFGIGGQFGIGQIERKSFR